MEDNAVVPAWPVVAAVSNVAAPSAVMLEVVPFVLVFDAGTEAPSSVSKMSSCAPSLNDQAG